MGLRNLNKLSARGSRLLGTPKVGVLGALIPTAGEFGPPPLANDGIIATSEYRFEITNWAEINAWPAAIDFFMWEDSSFKFLNAPDGTYYIQGNVYEDDVYAGSTTVTLNAGETALVGIDATATAQADAAGITQQHTLTAEDAAATAAADEAAIVQLAAGDLSAEDAQSTASADSAGIIQQFAITATDATATAQADATGITQQHTLTAADATATAAADEAAIVQLAAGDLTAEDAQSTASADNAGITQLFSLSADDAIVINRADSADITLGNVTSLAAADASATASADTPAIAVTVQLLAMDAVVEPECDTALIQQLFGLAAIDASATASADTPSLAGSGLGVIIDPAIISLTTQRQLTSLTPRRGVRGV